jgi:hypothetical protein
MLTVLGLALAAAAAVVAGRWWLRRVDSLGRRLAFPSVSVVLLAVLAAGSFTPGLLRAHTERRLSSAASSLVGARVAVHCQGFGGALTDVGAELGYVTFGQDGTPEHQTLIKRDPCGALSSYLRSDKRHPSWTEIQAVHVLSHESMHMAGITSEATAECAAMQRDARLAELLGASSVAAQALAVSYWTTQYPHMPDDYRSADCRAGGALDEHLAEAPWPT